MEGKKSPCCQSEMCKTIETFNNTCYFHRAWTKKKEIPMCSYSRGHKNMADKIFRKRSPAGFVCDLLLAKKRKKH